VADIFVSYKRDERESVEFLADELRELGFGVWFDASMTAGDAFNDEIEREARGAKVILVCWSPSARDSRWVKAEAMIGFEQDKLAAIYVAGPDGFVPPAPFNTTHAEDLRSWLKTPDIGDPRWRSLLRRIGKLCNRSDIEDWCALGARPSLAALKGWLETHRDSPLRASVEAFVNARAGQENAGASWAETRLAAVTQAWPWRAELRAWRDRIEQFVRSHPVRATLAATALLALVVLGGYLSWPRPEPPVSLTVAVAPFRSLNVEPDAQMYAESISLSVASALSTSGIQVLSQAADPQLQARYVIDGDVRREGDVIHVTVRINDGEGGVTLRSMGFQSEVSETATLPARIGSRVASLAWALQVSTAGDANAPLVSGLMRVVELQDAGDYMASYETARDLAREFPNEPMAHFLHAMNAGYAIWEIPSENYQAAMAAARASARRSHQLAPRFGEAYAADYMLTLRHRWAEREGYLRRALEIDPSTANISTFLSALLVSAGRMRDAEPLMEAAVARDPFNTYKVGLRLAILVGLGDREAAEALYEDADATWPNHPEITRFRFEASSFAGAPSDAEVMLNNPVFSEAIEPSDGPQPAHLMVRALSTRRARDIEAASEACDIDRIVWRGGYGPEVCLIGLVMLGQLDRAFLIAQRSYPDQRALTPESAADLELRRSARMRTPSTLFKSELAPFRADPRFVELAQRIGLLDYWRVNGNEPDFCATEPAPVCDLL
jgi:TolB-like protein